MEPPKILEIGTRKMVGLFIETSLIENKTSVLWNQFMPRVKEILNRVGRDLYSIQEFEKGLIMDEFTPSTKFKKWAAVEVISFKNTPEGLENFTLAGGLHAIFLHKGFASTFHRTSQYIFGQWLPNSKYEVDHRPHFEIMGKDYLGPEDPDSLEEVWVPVKVKLQT
jgi:AraC family transcriptional regulator